MHAALLKILDQEKPSYDEVEALLGVAIVTMIAQVFDDDGTRHRRFYSFAKRTALALEDLPENLSTRH